MSVFVKTRQKKPLSELSGKVVHLEDEYSRGEYSRTTEETTIGADSGTLQAVSHVRARNADCCLYCLALGALSRSGM